MGPNRRNTELIKLVKEAFFENWSGDSGQDGVCGPSGSEVIKSAMQYDWDRSATKAKLKEILKKEKQ